MPLLVRASNGIGSVAVALEDPQEAKKSIDELREAGFLKIGVYDFTGQEIDPDQLGLPLNEQRGPEATDGGKKP